MTKVRIASLLPFWALSIFARRFDTPGAFELPELGSAIWMDAHYWKYVRRDRRRIRRRAIWCALKYGLLPWRAYEREKHYDKGYFGHAGMNIAYAWRWLRRRETDEDIEFEQRVNWSR